MAESLTGPNFGHPTFNCNICSSFTQRTSIKLEPFTGIEPCEWVDADLWVLWVESEQILHLKLVVRIWALSEVRPFTLPLQLPPIQLKDCNNPIHKVPGNDIVICDLQVKREWK